MRVDGKPEGLRQSMSWLHTWSGLLLGWLLYAVFFTGTLSYFLDEVNAWMKPEQHRSIPGPQTAQRAVDAMATLAPKASNWTLVLPGERQTVVEASWRDIGAPAGRAGTRRAELDAATGEQIHSRETRGGNFLYRFHFELHGMPRTWGRWVVGIATMMMFVAILSGVVTHKKIFTDFFTFRPRKGQRSWLDAHNATAVLALPFHIMITFSGLLLLMFMLMPWAIDAAYNGDHQAYFAERRTTGAGGGGGGAPPAPRAARAPSSETPAAMAPLAPMLAEAAVRWPGREVGSITVQNPGTARMTVELREQGGRSLVDRGASQRLVFDGRTGELRSTPTATEPSAASATYNVVTAAHLGRFAGPAMRWFLFLSGVLGTFMAASGLVLWVVKRLPERRKLGRTPLGHRLVEILNVGSVAGLSVATAGYFWLNRLIPAALEGRADLEILGFFLVWASCAAFGMLRSHRRAWTELMVLAAVMFALLPVLNAWTGGAALPIALREGLWPIAGFDLAMLVLATVHALVGYKLLRQPAASAPRKGATRAGGGHAVPVAQAREKSA
ncbi:PepSY-associated TM helix domain-containing protein [Pseudorhodoferax soli]|uniref:Putative iron-regulated membrane protein n=1 Tax=Pseudorhodoferax soli TaxID=545864 RepID=A0A368XQ40_9BURK|nr:PepSY-associated TM helix domain-containing protein [Pseudorhodoferax soli]RCW68627.1 putative iron-regulated membrane protein [Pseudorhodoferax soli]